jgi:hypothetical protein
MRSKTMGGHVMARIHQPPRLEFDPRRSKGTAEPQRKLRPQEAATSPPPEEVEEDRATDPDSTKKE